MNVTSHSCFTRCTAVPAVWMASSNMSKTVSHKSGLLLLDQKCTECLLETYVKRSLSLNDGVRKQQVKPCKRVKKDEWGIQARRASSDSSTKRLSAEKRVKNHRCPQCAEPALQKRITPSRTKSFFRGFLNLFSRKKSDPKVKGERVSQTGQSATDCGVEVSVDGSLIHSRTLRKKCSLKRVLFNSPNVEKTESQKNVSTLVLEAVEELPDVVSVDSSSTYLETVSEELEWIVKEIQFSSEEDSTLLPSAACLEDNSLAGEDTTERIIRLLKQHGDIIDEKIKRNSSVQTFLQRLSYSSFQQLADCYMAQIPSSLPQSTDASPELVRLAFTLDFTAKVAGLCSQTVGRIMGFGNRYLRDSFTQLCAVHREVSEDLEGQGTSDPD